MENRNYQNYDQENRGFNQDLDTLIENETSNQENEYNQDEFINDINHQTNDYNRNESNPNGEPILNGEEQITNDEDADDLDDTLEKDGDLDDDDSEQENDHVYEDDDELDKISHDPFPSTDPGNF